MFPRLCVSTVVLFESSLLPQLYAVTALCSHSLIVLQLYVPTAASFQGKKTNQPETKLTSDVLKAGQNTSGVRRSFVTLSVI